jgi:nicotinamidase/pyrazinamidase
LDKKYIIGNTDALLVTDVQLCFLPGGELPVPNGDTIIPALNQYLRRFKQAKSKIFAARDWHPPNHISFKEQGGPWPPHCVQSTETANFHPDLRLPPDTIVISKAIDPHKESYSVFGAENFAKQLKNEGITRLFIGGLATDYCIINTVLDAHKHGFKTVVLVDATLGINSEKGDVDRALEKMVNDGAQQATIANFPDAVDSLPVEVAETDALEKKTVERNIMKKQARMRSREGGTRIRREKS